MNDPQAAPRVLERNLIFVGGKGGVGKTTVSRGLAECLAARGRRTLWVTIEDPLAPPGALTQLAPNLMHLNCDAQVAFEEYVSLKIPMGGLAKLFASNRLIKYLSKAAPGIHELVILGKIWWEREHYDHVVVDMLSTGYGIAMFQSTKNFSSLFRGGPLHKDAHAILETMADPSRVGFLILALPEEMPLQEAIEYDALLQSFFPQNRAAFLVNRTFPEAATSAGPAPTNSSEAFCVRRREQEAINLSLWSDSGIRFSKVPAYFEDKSRKLCEWFTQHRAAVEP